MASANTVDNFLDNLDTIILSFVQGSFGNLSGPMETLWKSMFIVFIAFYGYKVIINGRFSAHDGIIHIAKMLVILVLITSWTDFQIFVMDVVTNTPSELAGELLKSATIGAPDADSANTALGDFYDRAIQVSKKINEGAGWNVAIIAYGWAVFLAGLALTGYALILIALSKIAVALMLAVAPFFILMLIFAQTKTLFEGWLRTTLNYALIPIFVYGLLSLLLVLVNKSLVKMEASVTATSEIMTYAAPFLLVCVISVGLLMQVMNLASGIAGGLSLQTMGLGKMAAKGIGAGAGLAGGVGRIHADKALDKAFKTGDHAKNKSPDSGNKDPNAEKVKAAAAENREIKK